MASGHLPTPTEYIEHHLAFLKHPFGGGSFWTIHVDTIVMSLICGIVGFGFLWMITRKASAGVPSKLQAFAELTFRLRR